ncbi:hypothetical protein SELA5_p0004 (plasmid) [Salmonella enterica subsp. enterica serovar Enteritidis str. LA5]|nr:hypothetical protein SELA5_p0004 [Salmonella enterica subsp. enterica serovar Enteritidis str. LA5]
MVQVAAG